MSLFKAFRERAAAFRNDDQGTIAVLFAVGFGMMMAFTGAAIDITRAVLAHSLLQQATDSAGLAAVNLARSEGSDLSSVDSFESTVGVFIVTNLEAALAESAPLKMSAEYTVTIVNGELVITAKADRVSLHNLKGCFHLLQLLLLRGRTRRPCLARRRHIARSELSWF